MEQTGGKTGGGHQQSAEQHVGEVRHRGVGQTPLPVRAFDRHHGAVQDREEDKEHRHPLGPGPGQQVGPEAEPGQADDGEGSGLDDGNRVEQGRDRGRRDGRPGEPGMEGEDRGLDAEAEEAEDEEDPRDLRPVGVAGQEAAQGKAPVAPVCDQEDHRGKGEGRPAEGEEEIGPRRLACRAGHRVEDQRHRGKGQQLIVEIQGKEVGRHRHAEAGGVGHREKAEEGDLPRLMLHVGQGVENRQRPERRQDPGKEAAQPVEPVGNDQSVGEGGQAEGRGRAGQDQRPDQDRGRAGQGKREQLRRSGLFLFQQQKSGASEHRQQDRRKHPNGSHGTPLRTGPLPARRGR